MCACYQHLLEALVHAPAFVCLHVSVCGKHVRKQQSGTACYVLVYVVEAARVLFFTAPRNCHPVGVMKLAPFVSLPRDHRIEVRPERSAITVRVGA
jgi:hypothetical protein